MAVWGLFLYEDFHKARVCFLLNIDMPARPAVLTYCANRRTTVPMYADAFGLLVFGALLTSYYRKPQNRQNIMAVWGLPIILP